MDRFIRSIKDSLLTKNYYAALLMAITMPDICGKLESPMKKSQERFVDWYNRYMINRYTSVFMEGPEVLLKGDDLYALRCSFLHEGVDNIMEQKARKALNSFVFVKPGANFLHCNRCDNKLQIQVDQFCLDVCEGIEKWVDDVVNGNQDVKNRCQELLTIHSQDGLSV